MDDSYYLITFDSTYDSMKAEAALNGKIEMRIVALPPEISAGCGFALRLLNDNYSEFLSIVKDSIKISGYYRVYRVGGIRKFEKIK